MGGTLSLSTKVEVFPCPHCGETINTSLSICPFCQAAIDHSAALLSAEETSRISQACSDASYLKIMAWSLPAFFLMRIFPFLGFVGIVGIWFLRFAIPVMVIRWQIKFRKIRTSDPDFASAKRAALIVGFVAGFALVSILA